MASDSSSPLLTGQPCIASLALRPKLELSYFAPGDAVEISICVENLSTQPGTSTGPLPATSKLRKGAMFSVCVAVLEAECLVTESNSVKLDPPLPLDPYQKTLEITGWTANTLPGYVTGGWTTTIVDKYGRINIELDEDYPLPNSPMYGSMSGEVCLGTVHATALASAIGDPYNIEGKFVIKGNTPKCLVDARASTVQSRAL